MNYEKLKKLILTRFNTYNEFAKFVGLDDLTVVNLLTGNVEFDLETIKTWSKVLGISLEDAGEYFFTLKVKNDEQKEGDTSFES